MRQALKDISNNGRNNPKHHAGLAYDIWAPVQDGGDTPGKIDTGVKQTWLQRVAETEISPDYHHAFKRWKESFRPGKDRTAKLTLASRLLVGHGNPAPTEVGLTLHHTWGVPVIPGSALKGLCAHYVESCYGPDVPTNSPWKDGERGDFQGICWNGTSIEAGPGKIYRLLFGAPDAKQDKAYETARYEHGASRGKVIFHDALYIPNSIQNNKPFAVDVLTVHQKSYYNVAERNTRSEPNDYEDPTPIGFLSARRGAKFLLALTGDPDGVVLAEYFLGKALAEWGVGGKTAAGYGQLHSEDELERMRQEQVLNRDPIVGDRVQVFSSQARPGNVGRIGRVNAVIGTSRRVQLSPDDGNGRLKGTYAFEEIKILFEDQNE